MVTTLTKRCRSLNIPWKDNTVVLDYKLESLAEKTYSISSTNILYNMFNITYLRLAVQVD